MTEENDGGLEALRPTTWDGYVGQMQVKAHVRLMTRAARDRGECCEHLLFHGQAGLGKTTLAYLIGREMEVPVRTITGPTLMKAGDVAAILSNIEANEILFIDEIHRMGQHAEEVLYPALESRRLHLVVGKGPSAKTVSIGLPPFTMVGATTRASLLSSPLRSRFGAVLRLDYYAPRDIEQIIVRSAGILDVRVSTEATARLARVSRFTPRVANRLLRRARDWAQVHGEGVIDETAVSGALDLMQIDEQGLDRTDRYLLETVLTKFGGGPVGVQALSAALGEDRATIEDVYEPYLMSVGFINRTRLGRVVTPAGREHVCQNKTSDNL
jgi:holliday junction DNA helicase RuvB